MAYAPVASFPIEHNGASVSLTINAGESVIVVAMDGGAQGSTLTLSDGTNTYVSRGSKNDTRNGFTTTLLDCMTPTPGTYTLVMAGQVGTGAMNISKYTGLSAFSAGSFASFFAGATPPTTTDGCTTAAITPSSYAAMIFGAGQTAASTVLTAGTGFTSRYANSLGGDGGNGVYVEDLRLTSGSNIASYTMTTGGSDVTVIGAAYLETPVTIPPTSYFLESMEYF